jgi:hypothetical protein
MIERISRDFAHTVTSTVFGCVEKTERRMATVRHFAGGALLLVTFVFLTACGSDESSTPILTARYSAVNLNGEELAEDSMLEVDPGNTVGADQSGLGYVQLDGPSEIVVFKAGTFDVPEAAANSDQSLSVDLAGGHLAVRLGEDADASVAVRAGERMFTTLESGTEFALCYNAENGSVCLVVLQGAVEWLNPDGQKWEFTTGQRFGEVGTFASGPTAPPEPPRCGPEGAGREWMAAIEGGEDAPALPALVDGWQPDSCNGG